MSFTLRPLVFTTNEKTSFSVNTAARAISTSVRRAVRIRQECVARDIEERAARGDRAQSAGSRGDHGGELRGRVGRSAGGISGHGPRAGAHDVSWQPGSFGGSAGAYLRCH